MLPVRGLSTDATEFWLEQPELRRRDAEAHCVCVGDRQMQQGRGGYLALRPCEERPTKQEAAKARDRRSKRTSLRGPRRTLRDRPGDAGKRRVELKLLKGQTASPSGRPRHAEKSGLTNPGRPQKSIGHIVFSVLGKEQRLPRRTVSTAHEGISE